MAAAFAAPGLFGWEGQQRGSSFDSGSQPRSNGRGEGSATSNAPAFNKALLPCLSLPDWLPGRVEFEAALLTLGMSRHLLDRDEECVRLTVSRAEANREEGEGRGGVQRAAKGAPATGSMRQHEEEGGGQGTSKVHRELRWGSSSGRGRRAGVVPPRPGGSSSETCLAGGSRKEEQSRGAGLSAEGLQEVPGEPAVRAVLLPEELASVKAGVDGTAAVLGWQQRKAHLLLQLLRARCLGQQLHALRER